MNSAKLKTLPHTPPLEVMDMPVRTQEQLRLAAQGGGVDDADYLIRANGDLVILKGGACMLLTAPELRRLDAFWGRFGEVES